MTFTTTAPSQDNFLPPVPCSDAHCKHLEHQITELSAHIHAATYRAHWLNWKCGINIGAAREKVRAMTRVATEKNEKYLLKIARYGTAAHVERLVRNYRKVKRNEALWRDNERHVLRQLDWYFDDDDSLVLKGRFTPEQGMLVKKILESIMDEDSREQNDVSAETFLP